MPTRQEREEQRMREIERITNRVRDTADRLFDGKLPQGFLYWAADLHLDQTENPPTEDDLLANITDGKDDLELDAYHIDDGARTIYLFQSKYRSSLGNLQMSDLANFLDVPGKLATPQILADLSNQKILEFAPTFRRLIFDRYELKLVYVTTQTAPKQRFSRANKWSEDPLHLEIGGEYVDIAHSAEIVDLDELIRVIDSLNSPEEIELTLEIAPSGYHESTSGGFKCLIATLGLEELARTFDVHKYAIFRFNPRGPLGSVAVNKDIRKTLEDPTQRKLFQLMNNGLSAVCAAFSVIEDDDTAKVNIRDFQIVNGCQTTYNVYADISHIRLRVSKEPAILHDGDGRGIHERRQLSHRAHKTISRCRELASARQRRQLSARLHILQLIQAHSSPLAILVTSDDPKDTRSGAEEIELTLEIAPSGYHESTSGGFKCLIATLGLEELARTFDVHKYAIFRFNPRGPLGSVAVNKDIRKTLEDPTQRKLFQLMNNGLSAVCAAFSVIEDDDTAKVNIRDFQIVNGCQTTYNVYDHWRRAGEFDDAKVTLKLIEDPSSHLRRSISSASNKQSQMKDWDFLFDEPEQQRLQKEFSELTPPVFYELRRGEHKYIEASGRSERATIKDVAQSMWAFVGKPGEAKDRLREIPRSMSLRGSYREVFYAGVEAERLRLPLLVYGRIQKEWRAYYEKTDKQGDEREHGRLHVLWLIGRSIVRSHSVSEYQELPIGIVRQLAATVDEWFPVHHDIAIDTIGYVVDVNRDAYIQNGRTLSLRQLFRSADNYSAFAKRHDKQLEANLQALSDSLAVA